MKVTRDKTQSVDLGNGLRLERKEIGTFLYFTKSNGDESNYHVGPFAAGWAEEILAKHFTPITITLETEDEACMLWHLLDMPVLKVEQMAKDINDGLQKPDNLNNYGMFHALDAVYSPRSK